MGYKPQGVRSGRGPLEAASKGVDLAPDELAFRLNLVTVERDGDKTYIRNHSFGNISNEEAAELLEALRKALPLTSGQKIYNGVSYRHLLTWPGPAPENTTSYPPHDYLDQEISDLLNDPQAKPAMDLVRASWDILKDHPVNQARRAKGLPAATSLRLWGRGYKQAVTSYKERWGLTRLL